MFEGHMGYEDLKSPELRMEYIRIMAEKNKFVESQDYFSNWEQVKKTYNLPEPKGQNV